MAKKVDSVILNIVVKVTKSDPAVKGLMKKENWTAVCKIPSVTVQVKGVLGY